MPRQKSTKASENSTISRELLEEMAEARDQFRMRIGFSFTRMWMWLGGVFLFFVLSSISLIFAFGYKIDWQNGILERTSVIEVSSVQPELNVTITVNGEVFEEKQLPVRIPGLRPGNHTVRISRAGSRPYEQTVTLGENERKRLQGAFLVQDPLLFTPYQSADVSTLFLPSRADRGGIEIKNGNELWHDDTFILRTSADITDARHFRFRDFIVYVSGGVVSVVNPTDGVQQTIAELPLGTDEVAYSDELHVIYALRNTEVLSATVYEQVPAYLRYLPAIQATTPIQ